YISEETRQRVLFIAKRENYIPNRVAQSLRMKNTKTLGIIMPDVMNLFFSELVRGAEDAAEKEGYSVILCNSDNDELKEEKYIQILQEKMVDGIILTASEDSVFKSLKQRRTPMVLLDRDIDVGKDSGVGRITVDNKKGAYIATNHLIEKGCKSIAIISSENKNRPSADRLNGYQTALSENSMEIDERKIYLDNYTIESGYSGMKYILNSQEIDGVFCGNDLIAIGAIQALKENKIQIPDQVKIVGFDDISMSRYIDPPLTTIRQPIYNLGKEAINMIISMIENKEIEMTRVLGTKLVERQSS